MTKANNRGCPDDFKPSNGLNGGSTGVQRIFFNPTIQDMVFSDTINQAKGHMTKTKEVNRKHCVITGNTNGHSIILSNQKSLEQIEDCNDLVMVLGMINGEKGLKAKQLAVKKVQEKWRRHGLKL